MVCIEFKPDLTYEIDWKHKIVNFFIEDDYGVKHRCGQSFKLTEELIRKLLKKLNDDCVIVSRKELEELYKLPFTSQGQQSVPTLYDFVGKLLVIRILKKRTESETQRTNSFTSLRKP